MRAEEAGGLHRKTAEARAASSPAGGTGYPASCWRCWPLVFWLTISRGQLSVSERTEPRHWGGYRIRLSDLLHAPPRAGQWLHGALVLGVYRVVAWVVSVMLPPMAIFFPLFTLLEDSGLPAPGGVTTWTGVFRDAGACGKQALTMCMGFGCNAAGVVGCRILDSPRERLIAILTNSFVPCNGRFPTFYKRAKRKKGLCIAKACSR